MSRESRIDNNLESKVQNPVLKDLEQIYMDVDFKNHPFLNPKSGWRLEPAPLNPQVPELEIFNQKNQVSKISADLKMEKDREKTQEEKEKDAFNAGLYGEFAKGNEKKAICADACVQPIDLGNCYLVAALAAKANVDPNGLMDIIKDNQDGTFTVNFPGWDKSYTVKKPTEDEIKRIPGFEDVVRKYGTWPLVVMKAFGEHYKPGSGIDGCAGGSLFSAGMKALNKDQVKFEGVGSIIPTMTPKELHDSLMKNMNPANAKDAVPVTASATLIPENGKIEPQHVFTVMKYEPDANDISKGKVTVRNPWGDNNAIQVMSLSEFKRDFMQMSYPQKNAPSIPGASLLRPFLKGIELDYDEIKKKFTR